MRSARGDVVVTSDSHFHRGPGTALPGDGLTMKDRFCENVEHYLVATQRRSELMFRAGPYTRAGEQEEQ